MLNCQQVTELVTDYLEGRLSLGDNLLFQIHLAACTGCRAYLDQMRKTVATLGHVTDTERAAVPAAIKAGLLEAFRDWKKPK